MSKLYNDYPSKWKSWEVWSFQEGLERIVRNLFNLFHKFFLAPSPENSPLLLYKITEHHLDFIFNADDQRNCLLSS